MILARRGLGAAPSATGIEAGITSGLTYGATAALATGSNVAGAITGGLMAAAPFTGPAAPFVAGIALLVAPIAKLFQGCGNTCIQATQYANQADTAIQQIHNLYFQQSVRTVAMQQAAVSSIQQIMGWLQTSCSNPALGPAGQRCISERLVAGGSAPWCPNPGHMGCDWVTAYLLPIMNDPAVVPDPVASAGSPGAAAASALNSPLSSVPIWVLGAAAVALWLATRKG